ncbi:hypothetical protein AVEN_36061-1 [Araneus ventricosus]|uniref:C2H2-type domain-containing protein n=1 Tax=Araneus ventricosus TaxID=182803 RepID=A0A4Y2R3H0_ARAVE|nr:hypothetical protein AVEN_36061-1 [Araneus ventricosus]
MTRLTRLCVGRLPVSGSRSEGGAFSTVHRGGNLACSGFSTLDAYETCSLLRSHGMEYLRILNYVTACCFSAPSCGHQMGELAQKYNEIISGQNLQQAPMPDLSKAKFYKCPYCSKLFPFKSKLSQHILEAISVLYL